jgi:hypothetical protein
MTCDDDEAARTYITAVSRIPSQNIVAFDFQDLEANSDFLVHNYQEKKQTFNQEEEFH